MLHTNAPVCSADWSVKPSSLNLSDKRFVLVYQDVEKEVRKEVDDAIAQAKVRSM